MSADSPSGRVMVSYPREHVGCVTIYRPEARNAINPAMAEQIEAAAERLESERGIRAIVLTGSGTKAFSAGADLATVAAGEDRALLRSRGGYLGFTAFPKTKPWIAAVRGVAAGGGMELALACDLIVAAYSARFGLPETSRGTIAGACGVYRLPQRVPQAVALEWMLTGELVPAQRAYEVGLVNRLAEDEALLDAAFDLAARIAGNSPLAVRETLAIARDAARMSDEAARRTTEAANERLRNAPDVREGATAFMEKRAPRWPD